VTVGGKVFAISQAATASAASGLQFVPIVPCRAADTRNNVRMVAGESRNFALTSANCGIPSNAAAYSLNVTVVPAGMLAYLTVWPTGQLRPLVSTLNSFAGRMKANAAIVPAGVNGSVSVFVLDASDVVLDVNGYFVADSSGNSFYPVSPCRITDTR